MDTSTVILFVFAIAFVVIVTAIPVIMMLFTLRVVKKTAGNLFTFTLRRK